MRKLFNIFIVLLFLTTVGIVSATPFDSEGWMYSQTLSYNAVDPNADIEVIIHRISGTNYEETVDGVNKWHVYVNDKCKSDYGDIRFTNGSSELTYYLWPDYTSSSGRFYVSIDGNDTIRVYYGNTNVVTTSILDEPAILSLFNLKRDNNNHWSARYSASSVVYDNKMWVIGGGTDHFGEERYLNDIWCSENGISWTCVSPNADWVPRYGASIVVYDNKMWIMGGERYGDGYQTFLNDVWYSEDGVLWTCATNNANWSERSGASAVTYNDKMWIMCGSGYDFPGMCDVWYSIDGIHWFEVTDCANFGERCCASITVYDNKIWIVGGYVDGECLTDVWYSDNGINWTESMLSGYDISSDTISIIYDNKIWLISSYADYVIYSTDGENWLKINGDVNLTQLHGACLLVYNNKMWFMGGVNTDNCFNTVNDIWFTSNGITWTNINDNDNNNIWNYRTGFGKCTYDNKIWIMGGNDGNNYFSDIWCSEDGINWTCVAESTDIGKISNMVMLVYNNKMWIMGGNCFCDDEGYFEIYDNIWYSSDGINWLPATYQADWGKRFSTSGIVYNNKMWIMGGLDDMYNALDDIWCSEDGVTWSLMTDSPGWSNRAMFSSVVYNDKMWVMGGQDNNYNVLNDIWYSSDGTSWLQTNTVTIWDARMGFVSCVYDDKMWIISGHSGSDTGYCYSDIWYSTDGINWVEKLSDIGINRAGLGSTIFNDKIWLFGGWYTGITFNDVWYSSFSPSISSFGEESILETNTVSFIIENPRISGDNLVPIHFIDTSSFDNIAAWNWNFGDNTYSQAQNPYHTYSTVGTYAVTLTLTLSTGETVSVTQPNAVTVYSSSPTATWTPYPTATTAVPTTGYSQWTNSKEYDLSYEYDLKTGTYTQFWLYELCNSGEFPLYGFVYSLFLPIMNIFGYAIFLIIWGVYMFIVWIRSGSIIMPLTIGGLSVGIWAMVFPDNVLMIIMLLFILMGASMLIKILSDR